MDFHLTLTPEKIAGWQAQPALFERFEAAAPLQFDTLSFAAAGVFLVAVALLSCWRPARAAMRIEPASALRVD